MNKIKKVLATIAVSAMLLVGSVVAAAPASAASNYVMVQGTKQICMTRPGYTWCLNPGQSGYNFDMVRVPAGKCVSVGWWSFTLYCAPSSYSKLFGLPNGNVIVKANW